MPTYITETSYSNPGSNAGSSPPRSDLRSSRAGRRAGTSWACTRRTRRLPAQVLPADDVPVPVGRPAHRPLVHRHPDRRDRPVPADARRQRVLPDRLRRLRPARRERRDQERRPPAHLDDAEHRAHARQFRTMGATFDWSKEVVTGDPDVLPLEPVALPAVPGGRAWPIARWRRSTGARTTGRWPASRSRASIATAGAAARWSRSATSSSGSSGSPRTPTSCWTSAGSTGPSRSRSSRRNWIGRSEGAEIDFEVAPDDHQAGGDELRVFTTRPDTLFGATFMVLAPEHPLVATLTAPGPARRGRGLRRAGPPADRDRAAVDRPREDRRRASAPTRSTRSTASGSRSASPTTCWPATAPARSWPCPPTTSATSSSRDSSGWRSGEWSPPRAIAADEPMTDAFIAHAADERAGQQRPVRRACRPTRAAKAIVA